MKELGILLFSFLVLVALFSSTGFLLGLAVRAFRVGVGW